MSNLLKITFTVIFVLVKVAIIYGQSECLTPSGGRGDCKNVYKCPALLELVNMKNRSLEDTELLRASKCGYEGNIPKVAIKYLKSILAVGDEQTGKMYDIPQRSAVPIASHLKAWEAGVLDCPHARILKICCDQIKRILRRIWRTLNIPCENIHPLHLSIRCQGTDKYSVCCGPAKAVNPITTGQCPATVIPPDPRTKCCGLDPSAGNKVLGGNTTFIDQYPWLTLIEYKKKDLIKLLCSGVLISSKYVLTGGRCVVGAVLQYGSPTNVRLGEYDMSNSGKDCVTTYNGGEDCTEEPVIIPIDQIIPHPDYDPANKLKRNDIALLKLKKFAPYTDFIRPICLPMIDFSINPPKDLRLSAGGWGSVNDALYSSNVKLHVDLPYVSNEQCQGSYSKILPLWNKQICAGGEAYKDSCKGGPLMRDKGTIFEVVGIESFGPTPCGIGNIPGVYTNVFGYNSWIRSHIEP